MLLKRLLAILALLTHCGAFAWGPDGHHTIGAIADRLIVGTSAAVQVHALLGQLSLEEAAVWADCAKGVDSKTLKYSGDGTFPECAIFETPDGKAAMEDFVTRNLMQCSPVPPEEVCHKGYHYADIAIQHLSYDTSLHGARPTDVVQAIRAAMIVLQGGSSPHPFNFKDKTEALLVLAHYVGDVHQPLHVGSVYLSSAGKRVNPDVGTYNPATFTTGGNKLLINGVPSAKLHALWDAVPNALEPAQADALTAAARGIAPTVGSLPEWPQAWASDTLLDAKRAFTGVTFGVMSAGTWRTSLPTNYSTKMITVKTERIEAAGAHLAQILMTIWP